MQLRDLVHVFNGSGRKKFLINLAGLDFVDSDGLGELTRCYSIVRQAGGEMKACPCPQESTSAS
jgi:anti-sigma B factor antagonist